MNNIKNKYTEAVGEVLHRIYSEAIAKAVPDVNLEWIQQVAGKEVKITAVIEDWPIEDVIVLLRQKVVEATFENYYDNVVSKAIELDKSTNSCPGWNSTKNPPPAENDYGCSLKIKILLVDDIVINGYYDHDTNRWWANSTLRTIPLEEIIGWRYE